MLLGMTVDESGPILGSLFLITALCVGYMLFKK